MTSELLKDLLKHSKMHDEIEAAREQLKKMKAEYKDDVYRQKAEGLVKSVIEKGANIRQGLFKNVSELESEADVLRQMKTERKRFDLEKIYKIENGERKINTEYLTALPIVQNYVMQQLEGAEGLDGYKDILNEVLSTAEHDSIMYEAFKNAIETFTPSWYKPAAHAADIRDAASFEFDMARTRALEKLEYATGTPEEKVRFDRIVAIENEIKGIQTEIERMSEIDEFRGEYALDAFGRLQPTEIEQAQNAYFQVQEPQSVEEQLRYGQSTGNALDTITPKVKKETQPTPQATEPDETTSEKE